MPEEVEQENTNCHKTFACPVFHPRRHTGHTTAGGQIHHIPASRSQVRMWGQVAGLCDNTQRAASQGHPQGRARHGSAAKHHAHQHGHAGCSSHCRPVLQVPAQRRNAISWRTSTMTDICYSLVWCTPAEHHLWIIRRGRDRTSATSLCPRHVMQSRHQTTALPDHEGQRKPGACQRTQSGTTSSTSLAPPSCMHLNV
jgi:hypothetical protein